jgi:alpha-galactosidase
VVHVDHPDAGWSVHGVVSADKDDAVFSLMRVATSPVRPGPAIALPGLDADADYRLEELLPDGVRSPVEYDPRFPESWAWWQEGVTLPGRILSGVGLRFPDLMPEHVVLVRLTRA